MRQANNHAKFKDALEMNRDELRAIGMLCMGPLAMGGGIFLLIGDHSLETPWIDAAVSAAILSIGISATVLGIDFLFRPGEPGRTERRAWDRLKLVGKSFALLGFALVSAAIIMILAE